MTSIVSQILLSVSLREKNARHARKLDKALEVDAEVGTYTVHLFAFKESMVYTAVTFHALAASRKLQVLQN